jgi:hypothetical protein
MKLISFYGDTVLDDSNSVIFPYISMLIMFWEDPIEEVRNAAKCLIVMCLKKMPYMEKKGVVEFWKSACNHSLYS